MSEKASHYWCELAEDAIEHDDLDQAKKYLRYAAVENRYSVRKSILEGEILLQQSKYAKAIKVWQKIVKKHPEFSSELSSKIIQAYRADNNSVALNAYLLSLEHVPDEPAEFDLWLQALVNTQGSKNAVNHIASKVESNQSVFIKYLQDMLKSDELDHFEVKKLFLDYLAREKKQDMKYVCQQCGFETKARYWHCPSCNEWDSFSWSVNNSKSFGD